MRHGSIATRLALKTITEGTNPKVITEAYRKTRARAAGQSALALYRSRSQSRAMSPKVKGFVSPQSWFVDLTLISVQ
jgi:hypothetical protein